MVGSIPVHTCRTPGNHARYTSADATHDPDPYMSHPFFLTGLDVLLEDQRNLIKGKRIGLLTHAAALTADGSWSAEKLWRDPNVNLVCLLGPEHGLFGQGGAGETVASTPHPRWGIPIHSLYGKSRKPTPEMLEDIDVLIIDLQDLGVRCYTFISSLCLALEAAAECGKTAIVTDRPIPLPEVIDGPVLDPAFTSFVAEVPFPLVYGMTQGESARYLLEHFQWDLDLHILEMWGYHSTPRRQPGWPPWVPPSTGIRSWESAWCYPTTVFTEALPSLDCGRTGPQPFQVLGAPWFEGREVVDALSDYELPGIKVFPHAYYIRQSEWVEGIRLVVTDPNAFRPVTTGLVLLEILQERYGRNHLWESPDARPDFFDQLYGTDTVRAGLQSGLPILNQADVWQQDAAAFLELRSSCLLYP